MPKVRTVFQMTTIGKMFIGTTNRQVWHRLGGYWKMEIGNWNYIAYMRNQ